MTQSLLERVESMLAAFESAHSSEIMAVQKQAEKLTQATLAVRASWSGSFAGWHSSMYFDDFAQPSIQKMFSGEWGSIHGIPEGWAKKNLEEVEAKLDDIVGDGFSSKAFDKQVDVLRSQIKDFTDDLSILTSQLSLSAWTKASDLRRKIDEASFADEKSRYVNENTPSGLMSRDSEAVRQGLVLPDWLYYQAVAVSASSLISTFDSFRKNLRRFISLFAQTPSSPPSLPSTGTLQGLPLHPAVIEKCSVLYEAGEYAEAVEKSFKMVRDRLRTLTSFETGSKAFGAGRLHIRGAAATNVDGDFNEAVKFLCMAIDNFRNEKSHTSDAKISDPTRAQQYLAVSSLALVLLEQAEIRPPDA